MAAGALIHSPWPNWLGWSHLESPNPGPGYSPGLFGPGRETARLSSRRAATPGNEPDEKRLGHQGPLDHQPTGARRRQCHMNNAPFPQAQSFWDTGRGRAGTESEGRGRCSHTHSKRHAGGLRASSSVNCDEKTPALPAGCGQGHGSCRAAGVLTCAHSSRGRGSCPKSLPD